MGGAPPGALCTPYMTPTCPALAPLVKFHENLQFRSYEFFNFHRIP
jgi:hypothetical protein